MALIRYPGSKEKLAKDLWRLFPDEMKHSLWSSAKQWEYREPFFGAGAIGFKVLKHIDRKCRVWLNDKDADLVCLWQSVHQDPRGLCGQIKRFVPSVDKFYDYKARDGMDDCEPVERGCRKLALHRMSMSGFGVKSGGPIGGRDQGGKEYTVECRWNPERLYRDVARLHALMGKFDCLKVTCGDFEPLLIDAGEQTFIYLDPPYYEKGGQLYKFNLSPIDHGRLAAAICECRAHWLLSYDDHAEVRRLYSWAEFHDLFITYTNAVAKDKRPKNREVAITRGATP